MVAGDGFAEFLREQLGGMIADDTLYVRVDDHNKAVFNEAESAPPLNYEKQGRTIDLSFWRVPERLLDEPDELVLWARAALAAAGRVAAERERTPLGRKPVEPTAGRRNRAKIARP